MKRKSLNALSSIFCLAALLAAGPSAQAQTFSSGSNGEDGALNITESTTLTVQEDGVHNYTTITVAEGATLGFAPNSINSPVILLASGDILISGIIDANGEAGKGYENALAGMPGSEAKPGPGGYPGGIGGVSPANGAGTGIGNPGGGPGGGHSAGEAEGGGPALYATAYGASGAGGSHFTVGLLGNGHPGPSAPTYGDPRLLTLTGGSGGAGANFVTTTPSTYDGAGGGAGGGAIALVSSDTITINGIVRANGGIGYGGLGADGGGSQGSGGGAGGAIRLMANTIAGTGSLSATGGAAPAKGGNGLIRIETYEISGLLPQNATPAPVGGIPTLVSIPVESSPSIRVTHIGGQAVPQPATGSSTAPDIVLPSGYTNPVSIVLETVDVPDDATLNLRITLNNGEIILTTATVNNNAASASVEIPDGTIGHIYVTADF